MVFLRSLPAILLLVVLSVFYPVAVPAAATHRARVQAHYESWHYGYGFSYPAGYQLIPQATMSATVGSAVERISLLPADKSARFVISVYQLAHAIESADMPEIKQELDGITLQLARQLKGRVLSFNKPITRGPLHGFESLIAFPSNGKTIISRQFHIFASDRQYNLILETDARGQRRYGPVLDGILSSLEVPAVGPHGERVVHIALARYPALGGKPVPCGDGVPSGTYGLAVGVTLAHTLSGRSLTGRWIAVHVEGFAPGLDLVDISDTTKAVYTATTFRLTMQSGTPLPDGEYQFVLRLGTTTLRSVTIHVGEAVSI